MNRLQSDAVPHQNGDQPPSRSRNLIASLVVALVAGLITWPVIDLYNDTLHLPAQWQILYAASTYAFAFAATLCVPRLAKRVARQTATSVSLGILLGAFFAIMFGSMVIVYLIAQALRQPHEGSDALLGMALGGGAFVALILWANPELRQKQPPSRTDASHDSN